MNSDLPTSIVIFGASGDLTQRKLVPSLFNLFRKGRMPKQFRIVGHSKTPFSDEKFRSHLADGVKQFASYKYTQDEWNNFAPHLFYQAGSYTDQVDFKKLADYLDKWEKPDN